MICILLTVRNICFSLSYKSFLGPSGNLHVTLKSSRLSSRDRVSKKQVYRYEKGNIRIRAHDSLFRFLKHRSCHCTGCRVGSSTSVLAGGCPEVDCRIVSNRSLCLGSELGRKRGSFFLFLPLWLGILAPILLLNLFRLLVERERESR